MGRFYGEEPSKEKVMKFEKERNLMIIELTEMYMFDSIVQSAKSFSAVMSGVEDFSMIDVRILNSFDEMIENLVNLMFREDCSDVNISEAMIDTKKSILSEILSKIENIHGDIRLINVLDSIIKGYGEVKKLNNQRHVKLLSSRLDNIDNKSLPKLDDFEDISEIVLNRVFDYLILFSALNIKTINEMDCFFLPDNALDLKCLLDQYIIDNKGKEMLRSYVLDSCLTSRKQFFDSTYERFLVVRDDEESSIVGWD